MTSDMAVAQLDWIETPMISFDPGKQWLQQAPSQDARKQTRSVIKPRIIILINGGSWVRKVDTHKP